MLVCDVLKLLSKQYVQEEQFSQALLSRKKYMRFYCTFLFCIAILASCPLIGFVGSTREIVIFSEYGRNENIDKTLEQDPHEPMRPAGLGAASNLLLTALYQEVPVLVPASLWQTIVDHKQVFDVLTGPLSDNDLYKRYGSYNRFKNRDELLSMRTYLKHVREAYTRTQNALENAPTLEKCARQLEDIKNDLLKKSSLYKGTMNDFKWLEITRFALCAFLPLDRYLVKEITATAPFYLFIPKKTLPAPKSPHDEEKQLGLKIHSFSTVKDPYRVKAAKTYYSPTLLQEVLERLFIKKNEVAPTEVQRWTIFIMGHGTFSEQAQKSLKKVKSTLKKIDLKKKHLEKSGELKSQTTLAFLEEHRSRFMRKAQELEEANKIAGLPIKSFQHVVRFSEDSLDTGLFFYSSCSAGGKHSLDAFEHDGQPMRFSFPIVIDTLLEAPAFTFPGELRLEACVEKTMPLIVDKLINWKERRIILDAPYDFASFFANARAPKPVPSCVGKCITSMTAFLKKAAGSFDIPMQPNDVNNVLSIRLPRETHFSAVDPAHLFCIAPSTSFTVPADKQLVFFTQPETAKIDLTAHKTCPFFCSLTPGKAMHTIKELYAPSYTLASLAQQFFPVEELNVSKLIHIHTLYCKNEKNVLTCYQDVYLFNKVPHPCYPKKHAPGSGILFIHNQRGYRSLWPFHMPAPYPITLQEHDIQKTKEHIRHIEQFFKDANTLQHVIPEDKHVLSLTTLCKHLSIGQKV